MRRSTAAGLLLVFLCAGLLVSVLNGQPRPAPAPPRPMVPGQILPPEGEEAWENQRTRVQVEVFQVDGTSEDLARIDLDKVAAGSIADVLARLEEAGKARLMHRVDAPTEFGRSMTVTNGNRVPVVQDMVQEKSGPVARNVNYQETGLQLTLSGLWTKREDEKELWGHVTCDLKWSSMVETHVQSTGGVKHPAFGQFNFSQPLELRSGQPVMFLASHQPLLGGDVDRSTLGLVRLTVIHLGE